MNLKELHDKWLAEKPEGAEHDAEGCPHCNPNLSLDDDNSTGGGDMKTFTEDEFNTAVQEAVATASADAEAKVADLEAQIQALKDEADEAEAKTEIEKLQAELDKAEIRVSDAEKRYNDLVAYLEAEETAKAEAAELEARREARRAAVKDQTSMSDERIEDRLDAFVAMSDEEFDSYIEDLKVSTAASHEGDANPAIPRETAMSNVREQSNGNKSVAADVFGARNAGVDVRTLN
jgi:DNA repair exonuclease SbcCD ATPase subunit